MTTSTALTAVEIPCCLCGTMILPNAANQCETCLAQSFDLRGILQRGPGNAPHCTVYQCRQCRRFKRTDKHFEFAEPESTELLTICLKQIPALNSSSHQPRLHLVDASWIWTEPHSMRFKLRLTIRAEIESTMIQQRVAVELHSAWQQCDDCNREYTNRTWHALVQLRQHRTDVKSGLSKLEMALRRNDSIRKYVLKVDTARDGFDFYFLSIVHAQTFAKYLQRIGPMRVKTSQKMVSADARNNTANMKYNITCDLVPLCRDDLLLINKSTMKNKLAGQVVLVTKVSSVIHVVAASPKRTGIECMEISPETYYRQEKMYQVLQASDRLTRFVVLDVELCVDASESDLLYQGPASGVDKYALADVTVARESDFGVNDETLHCVSHLGHLIRAGDTVLGYDLANNSLADEWQQSLVNTFVLPDVILVKKISDEKVEKEIEEAEGKPLVKKKKERRQRKENRRRRELEESAERMGFLDDMREGSAFDAELDRDTELSDQLEALEKEFAALDGTLEQAEDDGEEE